MDKIVVTTISHGEVVITSAAFDAAMSRYLPASPSFLRSICEERTGEDYLDIYEVSTFIAFLADWDFNVDGSPLSVDARNSTICLACDNGWTDIRHSDFCNKLFK